MASVNKTTILGRMGDDPAIKEKDGSLFGTISVATNFKSKNEKGELLERTEWHRVKVSGGNAKFAADYLGKGSLVYIEGYNTSRKYTDKDGVERTAHEVVATSLQGVGGPSSSE